MYQEINENRSLGTKFWPSSTPKQAVEKGELSSCNISNFYNDGKQWHDGRINLLYKQHSGLKTKWIIRIFSHIKYAPFRSCKRAIPIHIISYDLANYEECANYIYDTKNSPIWYHLSIWISKSNVFLHNMKYTGPLESEKKATWSPCNLVVLIRSAITWFHKDYNNSNQFNSSNKATNQNLYITRAITKKTSIH